jgi:hypothetical protein
MHYGDAFADFIAAFEPASVLPYLPDIARLEIARTRAYHAADAEPIDPARLRGLDPRELRHIRVTMHPSMQILRSRHPIVTIWAMNSGEAELRAIDDDGPEDALVVRTRLEVAVRRLPLGGATFLEALSAGAALGSAAETAAADIAQFDLAANLVGLIGSGAMVDLVIHGGRKDSQSLERHLRDPARRRAAGIRREASRSTRLGCCRWCRS